MEFTRLNTSAEGDSADGGWHLVIAPRGALQNQQNQQEDQSCTSLPRAHFLRPGSFDSAFSPYSPDLRFKGGKLQNWCPGDMGSLSPNPLAQPGFYSPKILRSNYCKPASITEQTPKGNALSRDAKESYCHSLPLPRSKTALLKQSELSSKPQGIKTSLVDKPPVMKASVSQTSVDPERNEVKSQSVTDQPVQTQHSPNLRRPEISKKEEFILKHHVQTQAEQFQSSRAQNNTKKNFFSFVVPPGQALPDQAYVRMNLQSSGYCKLSLFNRTNGANDPHSGVAQNNSRDSKDSSDDGNSSSRNSNQSQMDTKSKNIFGQPRLMATLRAASTPQPVRRSTIVEDLKKLIVMDDTAGKSSPDSHTQPKTKSAAECPQGSSSPNTFIFSSPVLSRHPLYRPTHLPVQPDPTVYQPTSGLMEPEVWNKDIQFGHGLAPLVNTACDLDWNSLVDVAEDYEMQGMGNLLPVESREMSPELLSPFNNGPILHHTASEDLDDYVYINSPDQISHLEVMLRRLSTDLVKEKQNKVALLEEVLRLRINNRHLKEESLSANVQLRHICQTFNVHPEGTE
ncbi:uncharacterized protein LOC134330426 [Trichomycterus rosablanca]|uniref:uncharacterized protein LOC134330426 n=1 Tax=Trichomycterus rosablanca TaxID=2290929 RepID=UPI002F35CD50